MGVELLVSHLVVCLLVFCCVGDCVCVIVGFSFSFDLIFLCVFMG